MNFNKFNHRHRKKPPLIRIALLITVILVCFFALRNTVVLSSNKASREIDGTKARLDSLNRLISFETQRIEELKSSIYTRNGQIQPGQGMFQALNDLGLSIETSLKIVNALSDSVELLHLSVGEPVSVDLDPRDTSRVLSFSYSPNPSITHKLINRDSTFVYERVERPTDVRYRTVEGNIEEGSSLDQTLHSEGIPSTMVGVVNGILLCKIPFRTHARAGDHFKVLLKERFFQDTIRIDGEVLYASYEGTRAGFYEAFFYNDGDLKSSFTAHYTADGEALIHSGLRYPLDRLHISSSYGRRIHPVTGKFSMHAGVDYRAPRGTPVYAVAAGTVVISSYDNANGNHIAIRHSDKYTSYYLHLSQRVVGRGQQVRARQIIGKVGSTGTSTGPHLHFGFKKPDGLWMDPLRKRMIATPKLDGERLAKLKVQVKEIKQLIDSLDAGKATIVRTSQK